MTTIQTKPDDFLQEAYKGLEFETGIGYYQLTDSASQPDNLAKVSWFEQAQKLGAKTIFFAGDYPTVLFFELDIEFNADTEAIEEEIRQLHLKVWNTSRVPSFFVALPGELRVYSAYQKPIRDTKEWTSEERWLKQVKDVTQVAEALQEFSRSEIESGRLFQQRHKDFDRENRVDQLLLKNLRSLRKTLEGSNGEKREYVHALIGRSIFICYLEDRKVLVEDYFADINRDKKYRRYTDVLSSKEDTDYLFQKLGDDFNGDLFPLNSEEIQGDDLLLLRDFLLGKSMDEQLDLFFWAYRFDIIPIELISNIYEEFYHEHGGGEDKGTHYTPTPLVDFVLSECLTTERLNASARVLDPACGSGIFLVEAFKRMVHHECHRQGVVRLSRKELTKLLTEHIVGIDVNKSAVQVAAFSLYLAFLDFLEPPDIREHKQLPALVYEPGQSYSGKNLFHADAFYLTPTEQAELQEKLEEKKRYKGRVDDERMSNQPLLPFPPFEKGGLGGFQFDVIVGNPPWGAAKSDNQLAPQWCKVFGYPVGDEELSQCFMWRVQRLLKPGGEIGLLVSTGVLFKHQENSKKFRQRWLKENRIRAVYNFAHVRHVFFRKQKKEAIAPFAAIFFAPARAEEIEETFRNRISYVSIKRSSFVEKLQAVIIDKTDLRKARQSEFLANDWLWKTYMWAGLSDAELIGELKNCYLLLSEFADNHGRGYQEGGGPKNKHIDELGVKFELPIKRFNENSDFSRLYIPIVPRKIHALGQPIIYKGPRLLIKRGVSRSGAKFGEIQARLAYEPFAFRNSIIGFRLDSLNDNQRKVILGIVKSSLAKYYHFLTCSTWGFWHDDVHVEEHLSFPIHFPDNQDLENRILEAVEQITTKCDTPTFLNSNPPGWRIMQEELDNAIFDLYELSEPQRDLVRDLCQVILEFFYEGADSQAVKPPNIEWLEEYRDAFLEMWDERLALKGKELETRIYAPSHGLLVGMSFELKDLGIAFNHKPVTNNSDWQYWFRRLSKSLLKEYSTQIYIDRVVKVLNDSSMFIIKSVERRFWTKSQGRQDARELLTEVFKLEWQRKKEGI